MTAYQLNFNQHIVGERTLGNIFKGSGWFLHQELATGLPVTKDKGWGGFGFNQGDETFKTFSALLHNNILHQLPIQVAQYKHYSTEWW